MRYIKNLFITLILLCILPILVKAFTSLEISTPNPARGTEFYIQLDIDYLPSNGTDPKIRDFHVIIDYDPSFFEYDGIKWLQGAQQARNESGHLYIDKPTTTRTWSAKTSPVIITFKAKKTGSSEIKVRRNGDSHYGDGNIIAQSFSGVSVVTVEPSTNTLIGSIGVEGYELTPTFKKTTTEYYVTVPADVNKVKVIAQASDKRQTIEGTGDKYLDYGKNVETITVKAQNGSKKAYHITITRLDDRTGDTSLKSITVTDTGIRYKKGVTSYSATVSRSVESVLITARTTDPKATLTGTGRKSLHIGENNFEFQVTSSKNKRTVYKIKIIRSTEELEKVILSSKLRTLKVNNMSLDLTGDKTFFLVGVRNEIINLPINYVKESNSAEVKIEGQKNLKEGINPVTVTVTEVLEEATEEKEAVLDETIYKILLYRNPDNTEVINTFNNIPVNKDLVYVASSTANHKIPASAVRKIKNNNLALYYGVVNLYNGILYQAKLKDNLPDTEIDASFKETSEGSGDYATTLPEGTEILLYVGDRYDDETSLKLYSYGEDGKYKLITAGTEVLDGYISFVLNGDKNFVVTTAELIKVQSPLAKLLNQYKDIILMVVGTIVGILLLVFLISKYRKKRDEKGPLY